MLGLGNVDTNVTAYDVTMQISFLRLKEITNELKFTFLECSAFMFAIWMANGCGKTTRC